MNGYFEIPWKLLRKRHDRAAHSMAVRKKKWRDTGVTPEKISSKLCVSSYFVNGNRKHDNLSSEHPSIRSLAISLKEACDLCGRQSPDTTQVAYLHLSGQRYDPDSLVCALESMLVFELTCPRYRMDLIDHGTLQLVG